MSFLLIKLLKNNISSRQGWTPKKMFEKADEFFQSMGMDPMPQK